MDDIVHSHEVLSGRLLSEEIQGVLAAKGDYIQLLHIVEISCALECRLAVTLCKFKASSDPPTTLPDLSDQYPIQTQPIGRNGQLFTHVHTFVIHPVKNGQVPQPCGLLVKGGARAMKFQKYYGREVVQKCKTYPMEFGAISPPTICSCSRGFYLGLSGARPLKRG